jgi:putative chitinase
MISKDILRKISPNANEKIISDLEKYFDKYLQKYNINTHLRICHFIAQCAHESAGFRTLEEYASGAAYEGRKDLGNTKPGDGRRYKGRGIIQLTGRANYKKYGDRIGYDLENKPELAQTPEISVMTACEYWNSHNLSAFADKDDITTITRRINGGLNGFKDRQDYLARAKKYIPKNIEFNDESTINIQTMLVWHGANIIIDGKFGPKTREAVENFQRKNGLKVTGEVDIYTLEKLKKTN